MLEFGAVVEHRSFGVKLPLAPNDAVVLFNARDEEIARLSGDAVLRLIRREIEGAMLTAYIRQDMERTQEIPARIEPLRRPLTKAFVTPERRAELRAQRRSRRKA